MAADHTPGSVKRAALRLFCSTRRCDAETSGGVKAEDTLTWQRCAPTSCNEDHLNNSLHPWPSHLFSNLSGKNGTRTRVSTTAAATFKADSSCCSIAAFPFFSVQQVKFAIKPPSATSFVARLQKQKMWHLRVIKLLSCCCCCCMQTQRQTHEKMHKDAVGEEMDLRRMLLSSPRKYFGLGRFYFCSIDLQLKWLCWIFAAARFDVKNPERETVRKIINQETESSCCSCCY